MSVKKSNNAVSVISSIASARKPVTAGVTYAGNLGIPAIGEQPSAAVGLTGGLYGSFIGNNAGSPSVDSVTPVSSLAGRGLTGGLYGQNLDRYFDSNVVGKAGAGIGGSASGGGVTNEGVITGGKTGNLEKFPTIDDSVEKVVPRDPSAGFSPDFSGSFDSGNKSVQSDLLKRLQEQLKQQQTKDALDRLHSSQEAQKQPEEQNQSGTGTPSAGEPSGGSEAEQTPPAPSGGGNAEQEQTPPPAASTTPTGSGESSKSPTEDKGNSDAMTYEQYIEEAKKGYQAQLEAARKQAELTRQRAVVDAQSSYMQNLASYGANAEQMAAAGMRGGGYSDYLNAQAYAQKRSDVQQANAQAAYENQAAEGTYQDYINGLNQQLAQKALDDQRLADQRAYEQKQIEDERLYQQEVLKEQRQHEAEQTESERQYQKELLDDQRKYEEEQYQRQKEESKDQQRDSLYGELWQGVLDPNSNYTPEAIDEFAREYGLSEQQATSLKNLLAATKVAAQAKTEKEKSANLLANAIDAIETSGSALSDQYLESLRKLGLSDADYEKAKEAFQWSRYSMYKDTLWQASESYGMFDTDAVDETYKKGLLSDQQYNDLKKAWNDSIDVSESYFTDMTGEKLSYSEAQKALGHSWLSKENKAALSQVFDNLYSDKVANEEYAGSSAIDVYAEGFSTKQFGDVNGMGKEGDEQEIYAQKIIADAKAGKIKVGQIVSMNYGVVFDDYCNFVYLGNGKFRKCEENHSPKYVENLYIPEGYQLGGSAGSIRKA